jgi:hypothetical protein
VLHCRNDGRAKGCCRAAVSAGRFFLCVALSLSVSLPLSPSASLSLCLCLCLCLSLFAPYPSPSPFLAASASASASSLQLAYDTTVLPRLKLENGVLVPEALLPPTDASQEEGYFDALIDMASDTSSSSEDDSDGADVDVAAAVPASSRVRAQYCPAVH